MGDASSITRLKDNGAFKSAVDKLLLGVELTNRESTLLLSAAIALLRYGLEDKNRTRSLEFAYWIILNYSLNTGISSLCTISHLNWASTHWPNQLLILMKGALIL